MPDFHIKIIIITVSHLWNILTTVFSPIERTGRVTIGTRVLKSQDTSSEILLLLLEVTDMIQHAKHYILRYEDAMKYNFCTRKQNHGHNPDIKPET